MADIIDFSGIGVKNVTTQGDGSLTFDPLAENGHEKAGFAALTLSANSQLALAGADDAIAAVLVSVEADGKVVASYKGFTDVRQGDAGATAGAILVGDSQAGGDLPGAGYVKDDGVPGTESGNRCWDAQGSTLAVMLLG